MIGKIGSTPPQVKFGSNQPYNVDQALTRDIIEMPQYSDSYESSEPKSKKKKWVIGGLIVLGALAIGIAYKKWDAIKDFFKSKK